MFSDDSVGVAALDPFHEGDLVMKVSLTVKQLSSGEKLSVFTWMLPSASWERFLSWVYCCWQQFMTDLGWGGLRNQGTWRVIVCLYSLGAASLGYVKANSGIVCYYLCYIIPWGTENYSSWRSVFTESVRLKKRWMIKCGKTGKELRQFFEYLWNSPFISACNTPSCPHPVVHFHQKQLSPKQHEPGFRQWGTEIKMDYISIANI